MCDIALHWLQQGLERGVAMAAHVSGVLDPATANLVVRTVRTILTVLILVILVIYITHRLIKDLRTWPSTKALITQPAHFCLSAVKTVVLVTFRLLTADPFKLREQFAILVGKLANLTLCTSLFTLRTSGKVIKVQLRCVRWSAVNLHGLLVKLCTPAGFWHQSDTIWETESEHGVGNTKPDWLVHDEMHHRHVLQQNNTKFLLLTKLNLKAVSRAWGAFNQLELPVWLRTPALSLYIWLYGCNLEEAQEQDLKNYKNLCQFFQRTLRPGLRPIDKEHILTSPADGRILNFGEVKGGVLEQVKGVTYSLKGFFGPPEGLVKSMWSLGDSDYYSSDDEEVADCCSDEDEDDRDVGEAAEDYSPMDDIVKSILKLGSDGDDQQELEKEIADKIKPQCQNDSSDSLADSISIISKTHSFELKEKQYIKSQKRCSYQESPQRSKYEEMFVTSPGNKLFYSIIYLAPGDYHRYHSPADWTVHSRRHFPGELYSVQPSIARWLQGLFNMNERAVYTGTWTHGFFSMTPVGATNVGSINVYFDKSLSTNSPETYDAGTFFDQSFTQDKDTGVPVEKGSLIGDFNLGSTIVLIFEAPKTFEFCVESGQKVKVGQGLGGFHSKG